MKSLTVAELRWQLDKLDPPPNADVFYRPTVDGPTAVPLHSLIVMETPGNPVLVCLTADVQMPQP
jgi:hypothetical protein